MKNKMIAVLAVLLTTTSLTADDDKVMRNLGKNLFKELQKKYLRKKN